MHRLKSHLRTYIHVGNAWQMLGLLLAYSKEIIDDCYTTNSVVTYDKENKQLILNLEQSNNRLCAVFPPAVEVTVTFQVTASPDVIFNKIFYDFSYDGSQYLNVPCETGNDANCNKVTDATLGIVQIESIIDKTVFSAGAVVVRVSDTYVCLKSQELAIIEENSITVTAARTFKCNLNGYSYTSAIAVLYFISGSYDIISSTAYVDMTYPVYYVEFYSTGIMVKHTNDRIKKIEVTITANKAVANLDGYFPLLTSNIAYKDSQSIGADLFGFYEFDMVTYTFTYSSALFNPYASGYTFKCQSLIFDSNGESVSIITDTTYDSVVAGNIVYSCYTSATPELQQQCLDTLEAILKAPERYTAQVEVLVFQGEKLIYGAQQYIRTSSQFRISCYSNLEIAVYADSLQVSFSKNEKSTMCDSAIEKAISVVTFEDSSYNNPYIVYSFTGTSVASPIIVNGLTDYQIQLVYTSAEAGIIVTFINDAENRQDKCFTGKSGIFRLNMSKFYLEGGVTMGVTCIIGICLALLDMVLGIYCKMKKQSKKILQTMDLDL